MSVREYVELTNYIKELEYEVKKLNEQIGKVKRVNKALEYKIQNLENALMEFEYECGTKH